MTLFADSESAQVAIVTLFSILVFMDIIGNSLVCVVIARNQDMRTPINYLLVNLAVADLMVAVFFAPLHIFIHTFTHPDGVAGDVLCKILTGGTLGWLGGSSSAFTLVAVAVERFYAVNYPHGNKGKLTHGKLKIIIPCCWIFSMIMTIPAFLARKFDRNLSSCIEKFPQMWIGKAFSMMWLLVYGILPLLIMVALYSSVVYSLWFRRQTANELSAQKKGVIRVRKRVTLMVVIVSCIFAICWLADGIIYVMSYYSTTNKPNDVTYAIAYAMILFNSAVNPFVYALVNERFRERIRAMMCCRCRATDAVHPTSESDGDQNTNSTTRPADKAETREL